jgi:hypothetical protein
MHDQVMAAGTSTSQFGKRAIHEVWSDRDGGEAIYVSALRGWSIVFVLAVLAVVLAGVAIGVTRNAPSAELTPLRSVAAIIMAVAPALFALVLIWLTGPILRALLQPGPVMRLDPRRLVMRSRFGDVVATWEEVALAFGPVFLRIRFKGAGMEDMPEEVLVPLVLLPGGATGLREAIRRVRPDVLARSG